MGAGQEKCLSDDLPGLRGEIQLIQFVGRGPERRVAVNAESRLADTNADVTDQALDVCPVGALLRKNEGYRTPIGRRLYDRQPIGSEPAEDA